jgi:predicted dehydrogenase
VPIERGHYPAFYQLLAHALLHGLRLLIVQPPVGESAFAAQQVKARRIQCRLAIHPQAQGGGLLLDLGSHLIDQAIQLFGPVAHATAELARS